MTRFVPLACVVMEILSNLKTHPPNVTFSAGKFVYGILRPALETVQSNQIILPLVITKTTARYL